MPDTTLRFWHGGVPGLRAGDLIAPRAAGDIGHLVDGCKTCDARRAGQQSEEDNNDPAFVYVTTDREYARLYAAGYPRGALYRVEPIGELIETTGLKDPYPSWAVAQARVIAVYDPVVQLTPKQVRRVERNARKLAATRPT